MRTVFISLFFFLLGGLLWGENIKKSPSFKWQEDSARKYTELMKEQNDVDKDNFFIPGIMVDVKICEILM